jgi:hypothetical protein
MRSLQLEAFDGATVPNAIYPPPDRLTVERARREANLLIRAATQTGPASGRYNCHGLVLASRRTNVPGTEIEVDARDILSRDGFSPLLPHIAPQPGDVAVYVHEGGGRTEADHTGFVCRVDTLAADPIVFIWSMWGGLGEFVHHANSSPYTGCVIEYWRLGHDPLP